MSKELDIAIKAAEEAGKVIMKHFGNLQDVRLKNPREGLVTEADIAAQEKIKEVISKEFPDAFFYAEEDKKHEMQDSMWIVDPIDGTMNFARGIKSFAVSIGFYQKDSVVSGVVFNPVTKDIFSAERGKGAFLNGKKISVSKISESTKGLVAVSLPMREGIKERNFETLKKIMPVMGGLRHLGAAALDLAHIASGGIDAYMETGLYPWDCAAGILLVEEAGGKITNENGQPYNMFKQETLVSSNGLIHNQILEALK